MEEERSKRGDEQSHLHVCAGNGDAIACEMTSNAVRASPQMVTSNTITITVNPSVTPSVSHYIESK